MLSKRIIINADDFGLHPEIDRAILDLISRRIVTSTSLMVWCKPIPGNLHALRHTGADCGLHLDFTSPYACATLGSARSVKSLIITAWGRRIDLRLVSKAINEQLDRFEDLMDGTPRFIDGHEHVHQFPIIRDVLVSVLQTRYSKHPPFIRDTGTRCWRGMKAHVLSALGSATLGKLAKHNGLRMNKDFAGVYNFAPSSPLALKWDAWFRSLPKRGGLVMCHPAAYVIPDDPISAARVAEYTFLKSDTWRQIAQCHDVEPACWDDVITL